MSFYIPSKASCARNELYLLKSLTWGVPWFLSKHGYYHGRCLLSTTWCWDPITEGTTCNKTRELKPVPIQKVHPYWLAFKVHEGRLSNKRGGRQTPVAYSYECCSLQQCRACNTYFCNSDTNVMEVTNHFFKFKSLSMRWNPYLATVAKNLRLERSWV